MPALYYIGAAIVLFIITIVLATSFGWVSIFTAIPTVGCVIAAYYAPVEKQNLNQAFERINQPQQYQQQPSAPQYQQQPSAPQYQQQPSAPQYQPQPSVPQYTQNTLPDEARNSQYEVRLKDPPILPNFDGMSREEIARAKQIYDDQVKEFLRGYKARVEWERDESEHYANAKIISPAFQKQKELHDMQEVWEKKVRDFFKDEKNTKYMEFNTHKLK